MINLEIISLLTNFTRNQVEKDKDYIYLFTDNSGRTSGKNIILDGWYKDKYGQNKILRYPTMTQAIIRGLDNAYPITTMVDDKRTQWTDDKFEEYKEIIDDEIKQIINILKTGKYKGIKFSALYPIGKGKISNMPPLCWNYLNDKLKKFKIDNNKIITNS